MRKLSLLICLAALAPLTLAACGGGGGSSTSAAPTSSTTTAAGGGGGATVNLSADPSGALKFQQSSLTTKAGNDTINFDNPASLPHNVNIQDSSGKVLATTDTITGSSTSTTVNLKPGTYTFFCSVDQHEAAGMKGTLTVK